MCLSLPAQVIALKTDTAVVVLDERTLEVGRWPVPEAQPGDWVLINAGQIVSRVPAEEIETIREMLAEIRALGFEVGKS